jgi:hypothetical protein
MKSSIMAGRKSPSSPGASPVNSLAGYGPICGRPASTAADSIDGARVLREEAVRLAGAIVDCWVVSLPQRKNGTAYTWWVDKQLGRIVHEDDAGSSTRFTTIQLSGALPDDLFRFAPPAGARKLDKPR